MWGQPQSAVQPRSGNECVRIPVPHSHIESDVR